MWGVGGVDAIQELSLGPGWLGQRFSEAASRLFPQGDLIKMEMMGMECRGVWIPSSFLVSPQSHHNECELMAAGSAIGPLAAHCSSYDPGTRERLPGGEDCEPQDGGVGRGLSPPGHPLWGRDDEVGLSTCICKSQHWKDSYGPEGETEAPGGEGPRLGSHRS